MVLSISRDPEDLLVEALRTHKEEILWRLSDLWSERGEGNDRREWGESVLVLLRKRAPLPLLENQRKRDPAKQLLWLLRKVTFCLLF